MGRWSEMRDYRLHECKHLFLVGSMSVFGPFSSTLVLKFGRKQRLLVTILFLDSSSA